MTAFNPDFMSENINIPAGNSLKMLLVSTSNGIVLPFGKNVCGFDVLTDNVFDCRMTVGSGASVEFLAMALPGADFRMNSVFAWEACISARMRKMRTWTSKSFTKFPAVHRVRCSGA